MIWAKQATGIQHRLRVTLVSRICAPRKGEASRCASTCIPGRSQPPTPSTCQMRKRHGTKIAGKLRKTKAEGKREPERA